MERRDDGKERNNKKRETWGGTDKMTGHKEQVDKDVIMINQQHV